jgi:hypothetical protein
MNKVNFTILFLFISLVNCFSQNTNLAVKFGDIQSKELMYTAESIDTIIDTSSIKVYGATNAEGEYIEYTNVPALKFDQDSGFTVIQDEKTDSLLVSLGSAWTTLIPDIDGQTLSELYQGEWIAGTYSSNQIVKTTSNNIITYWKCIVESTENEPSSVSSDWMELKPLRPSGEEMITIKVVETNQTGTFWDYNNIEKNEKTFYIGLGDVSYDRVVTTSDITVANIPNEIGRYKNGMVIPSNTTLSVILGNMFNGYWFPKYTNAEYSISVSPSAGIYEFGTLIEPKITSTYIQHDAGAATNFAYYLNNNLMTNTTAISYQLEEQSLTNAISVKAKVSYTNGIVKKDSDGNDYPDGRINAGSKESSTMTYRPSRYVFYGISKENTLTPIDTKESILQNFAQDRPWVYNISMSYAKDLPIGTYQVAIAFPKNQLKLNSIISRTKFGDENILEKHPDSITIIDIDNFYCLNGYIGNEDNGNLYTVYRYKIDASSGVSDAVTIIFNFSRL